MLRPCNCAVAVPPVATVAADTVIWAITMGSAPELAPIVLGSMKKIAALSSVMPVDSVQVDPMSKPGDAEIAPAADPSMTPTESHESNSAKPNAALFAMAKNAGLTPPISAPNGAAHWYADGKLIGVVAVPAIAYTFVWAAVRAIVRRTVVNPATPSVDTTSMASTPPAGGGGGVDGDGAGGGGGVDGGGVGGGGVGGEAPPQASPAPVPPTIPESVWVKQSITERYSVDPVADGLSESVISLPNAISSSVAHASIA